MGLTELETAARDIAKRFGAKFGCIEGHELKQNFPLIHAVGMA
jgi:leucyl aminopeptidase